MLIENGLCFFDSKVSGPTASVDQFLQIDEVEVKLALNGAAPSVEKNEILDIPEPRQDLTAEDNAKSAAAPGDKIMLQKDDAAWSAERDRRCLEWLEKYHWNKPVFSQDISSHVPKANNSVGNISAFSYHELSKGRNVIENSSVNSAFKGPSVKCVNEMTVNCETTQEKVCAANVWEEKRRNKCLEISKMNCKESGMKNNYFENTSYCGQTIECASKEQSCGRLFETIQMSQDLKQNCCSRCCVLDFDAKISCCNRKEAEQALCPGHQYSNSAPVPMLEPSPEPKSCCACHELGQIGTGDVNLCPLPHCLHRFRVQQLHVAVMRGFIEVVYHITRLLPHQAFLDLANNTGRTALHLAVSAGVPAIARHLIVCGASPVARDLRGNTPLHVACGRKDAAMVTHLTRPVTVSEVMSAQLSYAPTHTPGLLAADLTNYQGETCVHVAAMAGDKEILQHLTWYGADVNAKECRSGRTALHLAVEARDPELVAHIVTACRASVTIETYARLSPYQLALANGATGIATQLLDLGAPAQLLPAAYTLDDDDDDYEDQYDYNQDSDSTALNGWQEVDDIRLAGVPVHSSLSAGQALGPPPVSTAPHTINADLYF